MKKLAIVWLAVFAVILRESSAYSFSEDDAFNYELFFDTVAIGTPLEMQFF